MFSVIIPLYNKYDFICRAIDSVLSQTYSEFEIIVINDGSNDGGDLLIKKRYGSKLVIKDQKNQGVSTARNTGIEIAQYPYIAFLDADDLWHPHYLEIAQLIIVKSGYPGIIGTDYFRFNFSEVVENLKNESDHLNYQTEYVNYSIKMFFDQAISNTLMFTSSVIIKKEFFEMNQGFDPSIKFGEDLDVWFRSILNYQNITFIPYKLVFYSKEDESAATKKSYHLSNTFIPKIIKEDYFNLSLIKNKNDLNAFESFKIKWIYLRLYPNYRLISNKKPIKDLIPKLQKKYILIGWIYLVPFDILNRAFSNKIFLKFWKKYLNFCLRKIY